MTEVENLRMVIIIMGLIIAALVPTVIWFFWSSRVSFRYLKEAWDDIHSRDEKDKRDSVVQYSHDVLDYIRNMVSMVATMRFKEFCDTHKMTMVTKEHTAPLIKDIAEEVQNGLNKTNINYRWMLVTEEWLNKFIIDSTVYALKTLLEEYIDNHIPG